MSPSVPSPSAQPLAGRPRSVRHVVLRWFAVAAAIIGLSAASACGGSASDPVTSGATSGDGPQSFEDIEWESPIGDLLGFGFDQNDDAEAAMMAQQREAEQLTAECMQAKGFQYIPRDPGDFISFGSPDDVPYGSDEWVETYGFGITTQRFPQSQVGDLVGFPDENFGDGPAQDDPNQPYIDGLTEGEREAYFAALYGPPIEMSESEEDEFTDAFMFEPQGCQGEAMQESGAFGGDQMDFYQEFGAELEALTERVESDPRIVEFNDRVSSCVAERGLSWSGAEDLYERWESELNQLQPDFGSGDPFEAAGLDPEDMSDREMDDFFRELERLDDDQLAQLAALQAEELELAAAVEECGGGQVEQAVLYNEVRVEYEQQFVDANADALAEFAADE